MNKGVRLWIALSIVAVFLAGLAGGMLLDRTVLQNKSQRPPRPKSSAHFPTLEIMAQEMALTQEQQDGIRQIFHDSEEELKLYRKQIWTHFEEMRRQLLEDIKSLLDEEQVKKFDAMIDKYREAQKKEFEQRRKKSENDDRDRSRR